MFIFCRNFFYKKQNFSAEKKLLMRKTFFFQKKAHVKNMSHLRNILICKKYMCYK